VPKSTTKVLDQFKVKRSFLADIPNIKMDESIYVKDNYVLKMTLKEYPSYKAI